MDVVDRAENWLMLDQRTNRFYGCYHIIRELIAVLKDTRAQNDRVTQLAETMANENGMAWNSITARRIRRALNGE